MLQHTKNANLPEVFFENKMSVSAISQLLYIVENIKQCILLTEEIIV